MMKIRSFMKNRLPESESFERPAKLRPSVAEPRLNSSLYRSDPSVGAATASRCEFLLAPTSPAT